MTGTTLATTRSATSCCRGSWAPTYGSTRPERLLADLGREGGRRQQAQDQSHIGTESATADEGEPAAVVGMLIEELHRDATADVEHGADLAVDEDRVERARDLLVGRPGDESLDKLLSMFTAKNGAKNGDFKSKGAVVNSVALRDFVRPSVGPPEE